jgi:hypothetical protein
MLLSKFGMTLGMAVGMAENNWYDQSKKYFKEALIRLETLAPGKERDNLRRLVLHLMNRAVDRNKMVC